MIENNDLQEIISELDDLIAKVKSTREVPTDEFLELLDEINSELSEQKEEEKTATTKELNNKLDTLASLTEKDMTISESKSQEIVDAINRIKMEAPQVNVAPPEVNVTVPEIKIPEIKVPPVIVPETKVVMPDEMKIKKPSWIDSIFPIKPLIEKLNSIQTSIDTFTVKSSVIDPIAVRLSDGNKFYRAMGGVMSAISNLFPYIGPDGKEIQALVDADGNQQVDIVNTATVKLGDEPQLDAFNRLRISQVETIFDSKLIYDNSPLFWDDIQESGTATSTHSTAKASVTLGVNTNTAGVRIRQTKMRFHYQPGKSQLILKTFVLSKSGGGNGITARAGIFDANNGIYLEYSNGYYRLCIRSSTSGSPINNEVLQKDWNIDPYDGTGPSGITIDFTKTQILVIDYEWLGVGRVRIGFNIDGVTQYVHQFVHANVLNVVYMSTPNLPLRYELRNSGSGVASTLECICATVMSEGGIQRLGTLRHYGDGGVANLLTGTSYAMVGIKLKSPYSATVLLENASFLSTTQNDLCHWDLVLNPTVAGTFNYSDQTNSVVQIAQGAVTNTITNGIPVDGGYFSTALPSVATIQNAIRLGSTIAGVADTMVFVVTPITNNITVHASITWREL